MEEVWSKASDRTQSSSFGFFPLSQAGPSVSCQASQLDCIYNIFRRTWHNPLLQY